MPDVMMHVSYHRPVGAFMTALARAPRAGRPVTVEALMTLLAAYLNAHLSDAANPVDATRPSPDLDGLDATLASPLAAEFVPDAAGETGPQALGRWRVHPYVEIAHVQRGAALELCNHSAEKVVIRLPEAGLLAEAEREAALLSQAGDSDLMTGPAYYYEYMGGSSHPITTMEYFWSRIADYTTASCR